jgi:exopolyphosphatase / guanosine-5'-triphosphate,3'-diphosphate pyrophosphatase
LRYACIDIGSNTTRLLVAEITGRSLLEVHQERSFTRIGDAVRRDGEIGPEKLAEVVGVVAAQVRSARELGAELVRGVATASIRRAPNGRALIAAILRDCGLEVGLLSEAEEARLAFIGAAATLDHPLAGELGVVDVGGGSSELAVGTAPDRVRWSVSVPIGSGEVASGCLHSDPPSASELERAREMVSDALSGVRAPRPTEAVAVGGSAASLRRLAGPRLDADAFRRALGLLSAERRLELARRFALDPERVRLLPAGLVILQAVSELLAAPLQIGCGGVREGVLLEAGRLRPP